MHFAPSEASGIGYVVSFAIGASIVTIILWILRFFHCWYTIRHDYNTSNMGSGTGISIDMVEAYNLLPSMHFRVMWAPGGLAGTLWSIGNIASMVSVQNLGEGVGYSVTQASMVRQSMNHRVITTQYMLASVFPQNEENITNAILCPSIIHTIYLRT
jgi:hypothetical protein